jgi:hypothetical protein
MPGRSYTGSASATAPARAGDEKNREFRQSLVGETSSHTLSRGDGESTAALTDNYLKMRVAGRHGESVGDGCRMVL